MYGLVMKNNNGIANTIDHIVETIANLLLPFHIASSSSLFIIQIS